MTEIEFVQPMLCRSFLDGADDELWDSTKAWVEKKEDGHRLLTSKNKMWSRIGRETVFKPLLGLVPDGVMLDGELVGPAGTTSHDVSHLRANGQEQLRYVVFDLLWFNNESIMDWPLAKRRWALEKVVEQMNCPVVQLSEVVKQGKREFYDKVIADGGEGIIFKFVGAKYNPGSRANWLKKKDVRTYDVVVLGIEPNRRTKGWKESGLESLVYGYWDPEAEEFFRAGIGLVMGPRQELEDYVGKVVQCHAWGQEPSGALRHGQYEFVRSDKLAKDCVFVRGKNGQ